VAEVRRSHGEEVGFQYIRFTLRLHLQLSGSWSPTEPERNRVESKLREAGWTNWHAPNGARERKREHNPGTGHRAQPEEPVVFDDAPRVATMGCKPVALPIGISLVRRATGCPLLREGVCLVIGLCMRSHILSAWGKAYRVRFLDGSNIGSTHGINTIVRSTS
jgi:hypothetical protein